MILSTFSNRSVFSQITWSHFNALFALITPLLSSIIETFHLGGYLQVVFFPNDTINILLSYAKWKRRFSSCVYQKDRKRSRKWNWNWNETKTESKCESEILIEKETEAEN